MVLRSVGGFILLDNDSCLEGSLHELRLKEHISLHVLVDESVKIERWVLPMLQIRKARATGMVIIQGRYSDNIGSSLQRGESDIDRIYRRLEDLTVLQKLRGLIGARVKVPHTVYSIASLRRVTRLVDRIYGIIQVYGITCNSKPTGNDHLAKLHALEDEFGRKLVQKAPVLSQLFLHSSADETPRRSWLITQKCNAEVMGGIAHEFEVYDEINALADVFEVLPGPRGFDAGDLLLRFCGKAWSLGAFIGASNSAARGGKPTMLLNVDVPRSTRYEYGEDHYGLKLDYHISKSFFGHAPGNFPAQLGMHDAIHQVFQYYNRPYISGKDGLGTIVIALLGFNRTGRLPIVDYFGLVLVSRDSGETIVGCHFDGEDSFPASREIHSTGYWERIGLVIWHETRCTRNNTPHKLLPSPYMLQCAIV